MEVVLYCVIFLLFFLLSVSLYYVYKFSMILLNVQDDVENALDQIDESYQSLSEILQKPIFFDSIEIRQCVNEIKKTRLALTNIAKSLTSFGGYIEEIKEESQKNESQEEDI